MTVNELNTTLFLTQEPLDTTVNIIMYGFFALVLCGFIVLCSVLYYKQKKKEDKDNGDELS